jgi:hypothetical protein
MASASSARKHAEDSGSAVIEGFREAGASAKQAVSDGIEAVRAQRPITSNKARTTPVS